MSGKWLPEGPTWALVAAVYGGWGLLTWHFSALPLWIALPAGAWLLAWHGSLQHEIVHGHPTRSALINGAIAAPPLGLWMPYPAYRQSHLRHHQTAELTCPHHDPESFYLTEAQWRRTSRPVRWLLIANNTLLGRLTLGPAITVGRYWHKEVASILTGDIRHWRMLLAHVGAVAAVLTWVRVGAGMNLGFYLLIAYGGLALTLLRSFLEHRPAARRQERTAIVEAGLPWRLLFLNNNLHVLHHEYPGLPWYALRRRYQAERAIWRASNGGYVFAGYGEVARRYLISPKDSPVVGGKS